VRERVLPVRGASAVAAVPGALLVVVTDATSKVLELAVQRRATDGR
jgi:hypothetical protein